MKIDRLRLYEGLNYSYTISLGGITKELVFRWSDRNKWRMSIRDSNGEYIIRNYKLVAGYPMLADYQLQEFDITGYFLLVENAVAPTNKLYEDSSNLFKYFSLYYIYP